MSDFFRSRRQDKPITHDPGLNSENPQEYGALESVRQPSSAGIRYSAVNNKGFQEAHRDQIRDEQRRDEEMRRQAQRDAEQRKKAALQAQKDQAEQEKKNRNAAFEREARQQGRKIYKNEYGDWENITDEEGRPQFDEHKSDPYQDKDGRYVRDKRDSLGNKVTVDADEDAKWKVGKNGKLIKDNKYNAPEERDASEFLSDPKLAPMAKEALYKSRLDELEREVAQGKLDARDPSKAGGLTESAREKLNEELGEIKGLETGNVAKPEDLARKKEIEAKFEADKEHQKGEKSLYEKEQELFRYKAGGIDAWEKEQERQRKASLQDMSPDDFEKTYKAKAEEHNQSVADFNVQNSIFIADTRIKDEEFAAEMAELEKQRQGGLRADQLGEYNQKRNDLQERYKQFQAEVQQQQSEFEGRSKSLLQNTQDLNRDIEFKNASLQKQQAMVAEERASELHKKADQIAPLEKDPNSWDAGATKEEEALAKSYRELADMALFGTPEDIKAATDKVIESRQAQTNVDIESSDTNANIYKFALDYMAGTQVDSHLDPNKTTGLGEAAGTAGKKMLEGVGEGFNKLVGGAITTFTGGSYDAKGLSDGDIPEPVMDHVRNLMPGNPSDADVRRKIINAIRENHFGRPTEDKVHLLDDGRVVLNPVLVFSDADARKAINESGAKGWRKEQAIDSLEAQQRQLADEYYARLVVYDPKFKQFSQEISPGGPLTVESASKTSLANAKDMLEKREILTRYFDQNAGNNALFDSIGNSFGSGLSSTMGSLMGAVYGVTGSKAAAREMELYSNINKSYGIQKQARGNQDNFLMDVVEASPSLVPTLASGGLGTITKSTLSKLGASKATAGAFGSAVGSTSMYTTGFAQSYGGYIQGKYDELKELMGKDAALDAVRSAEVQVPAVASGLSTAILMKLKPGGVESAVTGQTGQMSSFSMREITKMAKAQGGLKKMLTDKALRKELGKMLKETVWHGMKDEAVEEGLDQFMQGMIAGIAGDEKPFADLVMESLHAAAIGGVLGGVVEGGTGMLNGEGNPIERKVQDMRAVVLEDMQNVKGSDVISEVEAELRAQDPSIAELSPEQFKAAEDVMPEYGKTVEAVQLVEKAKAAEQAAIEAQQAGDPATARAKVKEAHEAYAEIKEGYRTTAKRVTESTRQISDYQNGARARLQDLQGQYQQALATGESDVAKSLVEQIDQARMDVQKGYRAKGLSKIALGKPLAALTAQELRAVGLQRNFTTEGNDTVQPLPDAVLEKLGLEAPLVDFVGDGVPIVTDGGIEGMREVSNASASLVPMSETESRQFFAPKAEEMAETEAAKESPMPANESSEGAPETQAIPAKTYVGQQKTQAKESAPGKWTATGSNGTTVSVEGNMSKAEAQRKLAVELGRTAPGETLNLDSVAQSQAASKSTSATKPAVESNTAAKGKKEILKKGMDAAKKLPKGWVKNEAAKALASIADPVSQMSGMFSNVRFVDNLTGGGFAFEGGELLIDLGRIGKNLAGTEGKASREQWVKAAIIEEVIHHASTKVIPRAEAEKIWKSLPENIRNKVRDTYYYSSKQHGTETRDFDAFTGFHEFIRMVIQKDPEVLGYLTEQASGQMYEDVTGKSLLDVVRDLLSKMVDYLTQFEASNAEVKAAADQVREAMRDLGFTYEGNQNQGSVPAAEKASNQGATENGNDQAGSQQDLPINGGQAGVDSSKASQPESKSQQAESPKNSSGSQGVAYLPDGTPVNFEWKVVDINDLVISNRDTGAVNPDYPAELQPRDRSSATSNAQVQDIANNTNYARLSDSSSVGDGAPVIGEDGVVESGNGRMMGLRRAYKEDYKNVTQYKMDVIADARNKGIEEFEVAAIKNPVLVRVRKDEGMSRREFVEMANVSTVSSMRESERAQTDAERLTRNPETLRNLDINENGDIFTSSNNDFIGAFLVGVPANERGEMVNPKGGLNNTGLRRIQNALIAAAYGSRGDSQTISTLVESPDTEGRNMLKVLVALAPEVAEQKARMKNGTLYADLDISNDLAKAVVRIINIRQNGEKVSDYLDQLSLGLDGDESFVNELIGFFEENKMAPKKALKALRAYTKMVENAGNPQEGDMFGSAPSRDKMWPIARKSGEKLEAAPIQGSNHSGKQFFQTILDIKNGKYDMSRPVQMGGTPDVMQLAGADSLPVTMKPSILKKVTEGKHTLPLHVVAQIGKAIHDPVFIFDSASTPDGMVSILDLKHNGNNVLVALHLNAMEGRIEVNKIASIYDKSNPQAIAQWMKMGLLRYMHDQKGRDWFQSRGFQLPKEGTSRGNRNLKTESDLVKFQKSKRLEAGPVNLELFEDGSDLNIFSQQELRNKDMFPTLSLEGQSEQEIDDDKRKQEQKKVIKEGQEKPLVGKPVDTTSDMFAGEPGAAGKDAELWDTPVAKISGEVINQKWTRFAEDSGTLGIPRSNMPQVKAENRGALVNYLKGKGIESTQGEMKPSDLKPTQEEYSPLKVEKAKAYQGGDRSILVSNDGHVVDGHHQWLGKLDTEPDTPIKVITLDAPIAKIIPIIKDMPSVESEGGRDPKPSDKKASRSKQSITFSPPIERDGNKIISYHWINTGGAKWSNREGAMVDALVSDWNNASINSDTGRNIVHEFQVELEDGTTQTMSLESAYKALGYNSDSKIRTRIKNELDKLKKQQSIDTETNEFVNSSQGWEADIIEAYVSGMAPFVMDEVKAKISDTPSNDLMAYKDGKYKRILNPALYQTLPTKGVEVHPMSVFVRRGQSSSEISQSQDAPIDDFGEKIGGARKDVWSGFKEKVGNDLPADESKITMSQHFPEPNYKKLIEQGIDEKVLATIKAVRDMIPAKPRVRYKLRKWVESVKVSRKLALHLLDGTLDLSDLSTLGNKIQTNILFYQEMGYPAFTALKDYEMDSSWWTLFGDAPLPDGGGQVTSLRRRGFRTNYYSLKKDLGEAVKEVVDMLKKDLSGTSESESKPKKRQTKFEIYMNRVTKERYIGKKVRRDVIKIKGGFSDAKEAFKYLEENRDDLEKTWEDMKKPIQTRPKGNKPRIGPDRRSGEVSAEQYMHAFRFRGVEFGNYVEDSRRQEDLNESYDALMDLAQALDLPSEALSLDGSLGMAFGARGKGGKMAASAHYEPYKSVINLTKRKGAGSLAHEWFRAIDNYFERLNQTGSTKPKPMDEFATDAVNTIVHMRLEVAEKFRALKQAVRNGDFFERSKQVDRYTTKPYWSTTIELAARSFEAYVRQKLSTEGILNDYLVNYSDPEGVYPSNEELEQITPAFDDLFKAMEQVKTENGVRLQSAAIHADEEYVEAYAKGDTETAQKMVDEAAKVSGYSNRVYHFTREMFDTFDLNRSESGPGIWVTDSPDGWYGSKQLSLYLNPGNIEWVRSQDDPKWKEGNLSIEGVTSGDLQKIKNKGIDTLFNDDTYKSSFYVATRPNQLKSADPFTFDAEGNLIPLSERFNEQKDSILYSAEVHPQQPGIDFDSPANLDLPLKPYEQGEKPSSSSSIEQKARYTALRMFGEYARERGASSSLYYELGKGDDSRRVDGRNDERRGSLNALRSIISSFEEAFGKKVVFIEADTQKPVGGVSFAATPNFIGIFTNAPISASVLLGHELGHSIKRQDRNLYDYYQREVMKLVEGREEYSKMLEGRGYEKGKHDDEMFNDIIGNLFRSPKLWSDLESETDPGQLRKLARMAKMVLNKMLSKMGKVSGRDTSSNTREHLESINHLITGMLKNYRERGRFDIPVVLNEEATPEAQPDYNPERLESANIQPEGEDDIFESIMAELEKEMPEGYDEYVEQAMKEAEGEYTYGRPDLGYGASDALIRGVDEARKSDATQLTNDALNHEAKEMIRTDRDGVMQELFTAAAEGRSLNNPAIVRAAALLRVQLAKEAQASGDKEKMRQANILTWAYRETGTTWAREGFARRDLYKSPADRMRDFLLESVTGFDPVLMDKINKQPAIMERQRKIESLQKMLKQQKDRGREDLAKKTAAKLKEDQEALLKEKDKQFDEYRERVEKALAAMGITLDDIFGNRVTIKLKGRSMVNQSLEGLSQAEKDAWHMLQDKETISTIISATKLSRRQITDLNEKVRMNVIKQLENLGDEVFMGDSDMFTISSAKDLLESPEINKGKLLTEEERRRRIALVVKAMGIKENLDEYEKAAKRTKRTKAQKQKSKAKRKASQGIQLTEEQLAELEEAFERFKEKDLDEVARFHELQNLGFTEAEAGVFNQEYYDWLKNPVEGSQRGEKWNQIYLSEKGGEFDISNPEHVATVARVLQLERGARWVDIVKEVFINNILSAPSTHITNMTGMAYGTYEVTLGRGLEAMFNLAMRKNEGATFGEFGVMFRAMKPKFARAIKLAIKAFDSETSPLDQEFLDQQLEFGGNPLYDSRSFRPTIKGLKGRILRIPGRALLFMDTLAKAMFGQIEAGAMAYRLGRAAGLAKGSQELEDFISEQLAIPGSASWRAAAELAEKYTFTNSLRSFEQGGGPVEGSIQLLGRAVRPGRDEHRFQAWELLATMFFPFMTTPYRLLQVGLKKTAFGSAVDLVKTLASIRTENGKLTVKQSDAAKLKMLADGTFAALATGLLWAMSEGDDDDEDKMILISGTAARGIGEKGLQYRTLPPTSIRIGGKNGFIINYGRLDPFSTVISTTVDTLRAMKRSDRGEDLSLVGEVWSTSLGQFESKTVMRGMADLGALLSNRKDWKYWTANQVSAVLVPNLIRNPMRNLDDYLRDTRTEPMSKESIIYNLFPNPWITPPTRKDAYGDEVKKGGNWFSRTFSPGNPEFAEEYREWDDYLIRYNRENPNDKWAPSEPKPTFRNPDTKKDERMTASEYDKFMTLRKGILDRELAKLGTLSRKQNPTPDDTKELKKAFTNSTSKARELMFSKQYVRTRESSK